MLILNTDAIQAVNEGKDTPAYIKVGLQNVVKFKYMDTDAWRGYFKAVPLKKAGWIHVKDGWVTGDWDDALSEAQSSNVEAGLKELGKVNDRRGYDTLVVFAPTSNVFSTGFDVFEKPQGKLQAVKSKKIANNTRLIVNGSRRAIRLHSTDILVEHNGYITLDNGGWDTLTTRNRISKYLPKPYYIARDKGKSYLATSWDKATWIPFKNGLKVKGELSL